MAGTTAGWIGMALDGALPCLAALLVVAAVFAFRGKRRSTGLFIALAVLTASAQAALPDLSVALLRYVGQRWGEPAADRVQQWRAHVAARAAAADSEHDRLVAANAFWNRVRYADDPSHWREADYWATPVEMLASNGGDCEDYVFGKYFTLRALGIPASRLRIAYARAARLGQGHMVLAYYATPDADPLILDNLTDAIRPASERTDLQPVYSFNDEDLWIERARQRAGEANQVRAWRELLAKLARERAL